MPDLDARSISSQPPAPSQTPKRFWTSTEYEREKRNFIRTRLQLRSVYWHSCLIFTVTWLSGWLFSALLLKAGLAAMPLRYAISFALAYFVFLGTVRVWADFMKSEQGSGNGFHLPLLDAGEGCLVVLAAALMACVVAGLFALTGACRCCWRLRSRWSLPA